MRKLGNCKIDRNIALLVKQLLDSGRWTSGTGRKHFKLYLIATHEMMPVSGSSGDVRMRANFIHSVRRMEQRAGFTTMTI